MNILFVLYGDFSSNSANPLALYARELHSSGHSCAVAVPAGLETASQHENPAFRPILYRDALAEPKGIFPGGRAADVIHACTPREVVRRFVTSYMARQPTPLVIYLEDNESWIARQALGFDETALVRHTEKEISDKLPDALAHPFCYDSFVGLADAVAVIQDKLTTEVPPWVPCVTATIGVDLDFFSPRPPDSSMLKKYRVADNEKIIVYHGGMNQFTRPAIEILCRAVGLINQKGYPCRLLRSGPMAFDFLGQMPAETASAINDLGVLPKQQLPGLLSLADVFVQPGGIDPFEDLRLPGKVPEFLAMGRPVLLPDANIAHLFRDGVDAVLLRTGTPEEIATKCVELFSDPQRACEIGRAGRQLAERYFDVRSQAYLLESVYKTACYRFESAIALETWRDADENTPIALMLARKLKLMAASSAKMEFTAGDILTEHARYVEFMQRRVSGLEAAIAERDSKERNTQILSLRQQIALRDRQVGELNKVIDGFLTSNSWRVTLPLRKAKAILKLVSQRMKSLWLFGRV
jgi:glycosyltransferase involved in cell wall biosynthesis